VLPMIKEFNWGSESSGVLLAAFFAGYICLQIPGGLLAMKFGGKRLLLFAVLATSLLTLLTPLAARWGKRPVVALRVVEGLCEGVSFPAMHAQWQKWTPKVERTRMPAIGYSGAYAGTIVVLPAAGLITSTLGWPYLFYICGGLGVLWSVVWQLTVYSTPEEHPTINQAEFDHILTGRAVAADGSLVVRDTPWRTIFTNPATLALIYVSFAINWGFYLALTDAPSFLLHEVNFDLNQSAIYAALPYIGIWAFFIFAGRLADWFLENDLSPTLVRRGFQVASLVLSAACFLLLTLVTSKTDAVLLLTLANSMLGLSSGGATVNHMDIAPDLAGVLMGIANTVGTIPGILAPVTTSAILGNNDMSTASWSKVFYVSAAVGLSGAVVFGLFGSGRRQY
jgi:MFS family permease